MSTMSRQYRIHVPLAILALNAFLVVSSIPLHDSKTTTLDDVKPIYEKMLLENIQHSMEQLEGSTESQESYYQISFTAVLNTVLANLRAEGRNTLADQINELALYVIGLERIKESGVYRGTEMERTLDRTISENKQKLVDIINALIK